MGGVFADWGGTLGDLLAALDHVILDPEEEWHKGGDTCLALADLLADMTDVGAELAGRPIVQAEHVDLFLRWAKPRKLGDTIPDDAVGYVRPAPWATDEQAERDDQMLALAGVCAFAEYTSAECKHGRKPAPDLCGCCSPWWALYRELSAELWLSPGEQAQVDRMADAVCKAIDARWDRRTRPTAIKKNNQDQAQRAPDRTEEDTMNKNTAATITTDETVKDILARMAASVKAGDYASALSAVADGERLYPDAQLPKNGTWVKVRTGLEQRLALEQAAAQAEPETDATTEPEQADATPEPEQSRGTLYLAHTIDGGTKLCGTNKENGPEISAVMGSTGQRWNYHRSEKYRYLGNSRGFQADMERLEWAALALRSQGWTVEFEIDNVDPERPDVPAPVKADSPSRRYRIMEVRGHAKRLAREAGLAVDDEPAAIAEPTAEPAQPAAPVRRQPAQWATPAPKQETAQPTGLSELGMRTLVALVKIGDLDAIAEFERRVQAIELSTVPGQAPREPVFAPKSEPKPEQSVTDGPVELAFTYAEGASVRHTAQAVRKALYAQITVTYRKLGVEIHVNDGRKATDRLMRVTVAIAGGSDRKRSEIELAVIAATQAVEGVAAYAASTLN